MKITVDDLPRSGFAYLLSEKTGPTMANPGQRVGWLVHTRKKTDGSNGIFFYAGASWGDYDEVVLGRGEEIYYMPGLDERSALKIIMHPDGSIRRDSSFEEAIEIFLETMNQEAVEDAVDALYPDVE